MTTPTRILLVDDHSLFRESVVRLLESEPDFLVVAHCAAVTEAIRILRNEPIDIVLLDYDLGEEQGTELLRDLQSSHHPAKALMVTAGMSDRITMDVVHSGVAGIILKHSSPAQLIGAIRAVARGEIWLEGNLLRSLVSGVKDQLSEPRSARPLTLRQQDVLSGILDGLTNKEIAWNLKVSESSIKAVVQELFHKAGVRTRSQLVRIAIEKHGADWLSSDNKLR
ncbi:MAG: response regulator transcription factor [Acidobacteriaceae bacterium]|jgi:two-component system, NarL family, nitrate/nitrite response regulator NarL